MPRQKNYNPICIVCGLQSSNLSEYKRTYDKNKGHVGFRNLCLKCSYIKYAETMRKSQTVYRLSKKQVVLEAKNKPCVDCGIAYPPHVMQFDHLPQFEKAFNISAYARYTLGQIIKEIAKCEVVCANCHAVRSYEKLVT